MYHKNQNFSKYIYCNEYNSPLLFQYKEIMQTFRNLKQKFAFQPVDQVFSFSQSYFFFFYSFKPKNIGKKDYFSTKVYFSTCRSSFQFLRVLFLFLLLIQTKEYRKESLLFNLQIKLSVSHSLISYSFTHSNQRISERKFTFQQKFTFQPVDQGFSFSQSYLLFFYSFKPKNIGKKVLRYSSLSGMFRRRLVP